MGGGPPFFPRHTHQIKREGFITEEHESGCLSRIRPPDILELQDTEKPAVKDSEKLIEVHAASVSPHDWHFLTGTPFLARLMAGLLKPRNKVPGVDVAFRPALWPISFARPPSVGRSWSNYWGSNPIEACTKADANLVRHVDR